MVTATGTQTNFLDALRDLLELEVDATEAYREAIKRIEDDDFKEQISSFLHDHERHIKDICRALDEHNVNYSVEPTLKSILTQGKVIIANFVGDKNILQALLSNEKDTNTAYERMTGYTDASPREKEILQQGYNDEKRHKEWLEKTVSEK